MSENDAFQLTIYIAAGFVIGLVIYKVVIPLFTTLASKTSIQSDDLIIRTIRSWVIPWFVALGLFFGLRRIDMADQYYKWLENGLMIFYVLSATFILSRIIAGMVKIRTSKSAAGSVASSSIITNIIKVVIYCVGILVMLQSLGISVTPILTALGVGGLAVALALQSTLANLFAGIQLISSGKINPGDFVTLASGEEGFIQDITWRSTTIRAVADHIIIVPNSKLADMIVNNFNFPLHEIACNVVVGVSYDSDLDYVEQVTKEVITETLNDMEGGVKNFDPIIRFFEFGDSSIQMRAIMRVTEYSAQFAVKHEFTKRLHRRFKKENINIPFPIRTVYMKKEEEE